MKKFALSEEVVAQALNYLASKPFNEVHQLIAKIQADAKLLPEEPEVEPNPEG